MGGAGRKVLVGALLSLVVAASSAATTAASAEVLVNAIKPTTLSCGAPVKVGVWYQSFSGGPRWARIVIRTSAGRTVWRRSTTARTSWRYWYVYMLCGRHYVVTYTTAGGTTRFTVYVR